MSLLIKPNDPLAKAGPDQQRELFTRFCSAANGFQAEDVIGAAINVLVNALRQAHTTRDKAMVAADEKAAKIKELLAANYTSAGRVKGVFPYNQTIELEHFIDRDTVRG
jgi:hypothetical protein